jgi:hypothetical protein
VNRLSWKKFTDDRYLKIAFAIGGFYDILLCVTMFFPDLTSTLLNVTKPDPIIFSYTSGLFLIIIGSFLLLATQDVQRLVFIGIGSVVIRLGYAILVFFLLPVGIEIVYILVAVTDTITAILLIVPIILTEGVIWKQLWQIKRKVIQ